MKECLCVRSDWNRGGEIIPISFSCNDKKTNFIRKIKRIWHEYDTQSTLTTRYTCILTNETTIELSFKDGRWYV